MSNPRPVSERRLAANRANAQRSTGPRTPEGKTASSRNAVKHGFRGSTFAVVRLEDIKEVADLKADAVACYKPVNSQEMFAVERIALAQQQILRAARLEAGLFTTALDEVMDNTGHNFTPMTPDMVGDGDISITRAQNRNYAVGEGFRRMNRESNAWSVLLRYQAQAERQYRRAVEDFERLKQLRAEMPNEPNLESQPEDPEDLLAPHEVNPTIEITPVPAAASVPHPRREPLGIAPAPAVPSAPAPPMHSNPDLPPADPKLAAGPRKAA